MQNELKTESVSISTLKPDPMNARRHDPKNLTAISNSLKRFGQRKPIVITGDGTVVAGNGTLAAAIQLGWTHLSCARVPRDWTHEEIKAYALADNRTAELAEWDPSMLAEQLLELDAVGWDVSELGFEALEPPIDPDGDNEKPLNLSEDPVSKLGDLWQIGNHRILCGDSQNLTNLNRIIDRLQIQCILTDPPYGINLNTDYSAGGGKIYNKVINDDKPFDAKFFRDTFNFVKEQFWFGANYYFRTLSDDDLDGSWLVWDKRTENTDSVIGSAFELCWSNTKHKQDVLRYHWTNFTSHNNAGEKRMHPTEKPVDLLIDILERWAEPKCAVIDMFAGSGTTLVAAAKTNRIGLGLELDPHYVDVVVQRLQNLTGQEAKLINL